MKDYLSSRTPAPREGACNRWNERETRRALRAPQNWRQHAKRALFVSLSCQRLPPTGCQSTAPCNSGVGMIQQHHNSERSGSGHSSCNTGCSRAQHSAAHTCPVLCGPHILRHGVLGRLQCLISTVLSLREGRTDRQHTAATKGQRVEWEFPSTKGQGVSPDTDMQQPQAEVQVLSPKHTTTTIPQHTAGVRSVGTRCWLCCWRPHPPPCPLPSDRRDPVLHPPPFCTQRKHLHKSHKAHTTQTHTHLSGGLRRAVGCALGVPHSLPPFQSCTQGPPSKNHTKNTATHTPGWRSETRCSLRSWSASLTPPFSKWHPRPPSLTPHKGNHTHTPGWRSRTRCWRRSLRPRWPCWLPLWRC